MDEYYTNPNVSKKLCFLISKKIKINFEKDLIIEPSAGNGSFIQPIKHMCQNCLFFDINPKTKEIQKKDYLALNLYQLKNKYKKIHIIGNPPFGKRSSLAIKFIKKSSEICDTISFILPKSFGKESMKQSVPLSFHLIYSCLIPSQSFQNENKIVDVPCIFQIWKKKKYLRRIVKKIYLNGFKFLKNHKQADFAIRRVGFYAGKIFTLNLNKKNKKVIN